MSTDMQTSNIKHQSSYKAQIVKIQTSLSWIVVLSLNFGVWSLNFAPIKVSRG